MSQTRSPSTSRKFLQIQTEDLSEWMTQLPCKLCDVALNKLAIPGSHDSGAFWLNLDFPVTPDVPAIIRRLGMYRAVRESVMRWSICQEDDLKTQLEKGIRYIDVRTIYLKNQDDFFTLHRLYGQKSSVIFQQIADFLTKHPKEIIILDFNHLLQFTPALSARFTNLLFKIFGDKFFIRGNKGVEITINEIWKSNKQIIAFYPSSSEKFWSHSLLESPWFDTPDLKYLTRMLNRRLVTSSKDKLNVFQAILSPNVYTILFHVLSSLKKHLALKCDEAIALWLDGLYREKRGGVNIVICDFISCNHIPARVVRLNELLL